MPHATCIVAYRDLLLWIVLPRIPLTTWLRLTRGRERERERNPSRIRIAAQGKLNLHLPNVYSFRVQPCERYLMFAAVIDVAYGPNGRGESILLMVKLDMKAMRVHVCVCVCRKLCHMLSQLHSLHPPVDPVQTSGRDHPRLQLLHQTCSAHFF